MQLLARPRHRQENATKLQRKKILHVCTVFISLRTVKSRELFEHSNHFKTPVPLAARSEG